ncbi:MAG TPA: hypothetical protein VJ783_32175 [Pirellulales bacterium]|nr:hypothetical protein [Pirellulales bacterium]
MNNAITYLMMLTAFSLFAGAVAAAPADVEVSRGERSPDLARRARLRETLAQIIDRRLLRLRENGVEHLALYRALEELRDNPGGAIALALSSANGQLDDRSVGAPDDLRRVADEAIQGLLQEPYDLRRRLKLAEIKQAAVDSKESSDRLRRLLDDARRSPGLLGRLAAEAVEILDRSGVAALSTFLEETGPLLAIDREVALACAAELRDRQAEIRSATNESRLSTRAADELVARQAAVGQTLAQWSTVLGRTPAARRLVSDAQVAADLATQRLFDLDAPAAAEEQQRVRDRLRELAALFEQAIERERAESDAADWAARAAELASTRDHLLVGLKQLDLSAHKDQLSRSAGQIEQWLGGKQLPALVDAQLLHTLLVVREAAAAYDAARDGDARETLVEQARRALDRAASVCAAELARGQPAPALDDLHQERAAAVHQKTPEIEFDLTRQPWFIKLPPENQRAIRAREKPFPLGFEERLKHYFGREW